jgi:hypothetical protein
MIHCDHEMKIFINAASSPMQIACNLFTSFFNRASQEEDLQWVYLQITGLGTVDTDYVLSLPSMHRMS